MNLNGRSIWNKEVVSKYNDKYLNTLNIYGLYYNNNTYFMCSGEEVINKRLENIILYIKYEY